MSDYLSQDFWNDLYKVGDTGWDIGAISTPIKEYFDKIDDKSLWILVPGCGKGYEVEYLYNLGFKNVHALDFASEALKTLKNRFSKFPDDQLFQGDFFNHIGKYDIIIEQTLFCALNPILRENYAKKVNELLNSGGKLIGVLFGYETESGPPYGGTKEEYLALFKPYFNSIKIEDCYNSIKPRIGRELFIQLEK
jgi:methyl halide transferase